MFRFFRRPLIVWTEYIYQRFTEFQMSNRVLNVIPAQAGIRLYPNRNLSDNNKIPPTYTFWIPACAGMTAWVFIKQ